MWSLQYLSVDLFLCTAELCGQCIFPSGIIKCIELCNDTQRGATVSEEDGGWTLGQSGVREIHIILYVNM